MDELQSCVKVEVAVLGSRPSLIVRTVSEDVKQHWKTKKAVSARKLVSSVAAGCGRWIRTERLVLMHCLI